jgi:hypothetical protein
MVVEAVPPVTEKLNNDFGYADIKWKKDIGARRAG